MPPEVATLPTEFIGPPSSYLERQQASQTEFAERAKTIGFLRKSREPQNAYVSGLAQRSGLGSTFQTSDGLYNQKSAARVFNVRNFRSNIAAPLDANYDPYVRLHESDNGLKDRWTKLQAMTVETGREALRMAGLIGEDEGFLSSERFDPDRFSVVVASGVADTPFITTDVADTLDRSPIYARDGEKNFVLDENGARIVIGYQPLERSSKAISPTNTLSVFLNKWPQHLP
jgi:hypothetical protein